MLDTLRALGHSSLASQLAELRLCLDHSVEEGEEVLAALALLRGPLVGLRAALHQLRPEHLASLAPLTGLRDLDWEMKVRCCCWVFGRWASSFRVETA